MKGLVFPMKARMNLVLLFSTAMVLPAVPAVSQVHQPAVQQAPLGRPPAAQPPIAQPGTPVPMAQPPVAEPAPPPPPLPPVVWDLRNASDLLTYIQGIGSEGLDPNDYDPAPLAAAIQAGEPIMLSQIATDRFDRVSNDLALGHVKRSARIDWHVADPDLDAAKQDTMLRAAIAQHNIQGAFRNLLPTHPQYAALKTALAATTDPAQVQRIRLNMDRWRWLPRDLGQKYIIVNVPGFHATLVENGVNRWKQRAIAGKLSTPTPQLNATAVGVMLNPTWEVPESIAHEAAGKKGFVAV